MHVFDTLEFVFRTKWITVDGIKIKKRAGLVYTIKNDLPGIAKIKNIYVVNGSTVFYDVECSATFSFSSICLKLVMFYNAIAA